MVAHPGVGKTKSALTEALENLGDPDLAIRGFRGAHAYVHSAGGFWIVDEAMGATKEAQTFKAAGQVVLFQRVMHDWGFDEQQAATLLGFENASDIRDMYAGRRPVGHRDANDRLRAVLRIAADLDALYQERSAIREWLNEPQADLGGKTPRALFDEGSMESLLRVKYYVSFFVRAVGLCWRV